MCAAQAPQKGHKGGGGSGYPKAGEFREITCMPREDSVEKKQKKKMWRTNLPLRMGMASIMSWRIILGGSLAAPDGFGYRRVKLAPPWCHCVSGIGSKATKRDILSSQVVGGEGFWMWLFRGGCIAFPMRVNPELSKHPRLHVWLSIPTNVRMRGLLVSSWAAPGKKTAAKPPYKNNRWLIHPKPNK